MPLFEFFGRNLRVCAGWNLIEALAFRNRSGVREVVDLRCQKDSAVICTGLLNRFLQHLFSCYLVIETIEQVLRGIMFGLVVKSDVAS